MVTGVKEKHFSHVDNQCRYPPRIVGENFQEHIDNSLGYTLLTVYTDQIIYLLFGSFRSPVCLEDANG